VPHVRQGAAYLAGRSPCADLDDLAAYAARNTPRGSVYMFLPGGRCNLSFVRKAGRDLYFDWKIIPVLGPDIYEWYLRYRQTEAARKDPTTVPDLARSRRIDYLVTDAPVCDDRLTPIYHNERYQLYRIEARRSSPDADNRTVNGSPAARLPLPRRLR
jgi:hypothetical protein